MKVVIDTNVLVSAILRDRVPEEVVMYVADTPEVTWLASHEIVAEYREVLRRDKFGLPNALLQRWFDLFDRLIIVIPVTHTFDFPRDRKDAKFLACCLAGHVDFLITGDRDFESAQKLVDTKIVSVSLFQQLFLRPS